MENLRESKKGARHRSRTGATIVEQREQRRPADEALFREMVLGLCLLVGLGLSFGRSLFLSRSRSLSARHKRGNLVAVDSTEHDRPTSTTAMVTGGSSSVPKEKAVIIVRTSTGYFFSLIVS